MFAVTENISGSDALNLKTEIFVRLMLILIVGILHIVQPRRHQVTKTDLSYYKHVRRESYVPIWAVVFVVILVPVITYLLSYLLTKKYEDWIPALLGWSLALCLNGAVTDTIKTIVSRPRPDFLFRCFPTGKVAEDLLCTGNPTEVIEGRKSFPSGHSSFSFCSMTFESLWLCGRLGVLSRRRGDGIRALISFVPILLAGMIAITRCYDNHHHWEDVIAGSLLGFICSYISYFQYYVPLSSSISGLPCTSVTESTALHV